MLSLKDDQVSKIIRDIKGVLSSPPTTPIENVPGYSGRRIFIRSGPWTILLKYTEFKGKKVLYVMEILSKEDLEYYFS